MRGIAPIRAAATAVAALGTLLSRRARTRAAGADARAIAAVMQAGTFRGPECSYPLPHRLYVPAGLEPGRRYPLVVYLHGGGERGSDGTSHLGANVAALLSPRVQELGPLFVLAPQCPPGDEWVDRRGRTPFRSYDQARVPESDAARMIVPLLAEVQARHPIDPDRLYVTGPSMGGSGTWDLVTRHPGVFAAAVPINGVNDPSRAPAIASLPIWAFHGTEDRISPVENTRAMIQALQRLGAPVRFSELQGVGHDAWRCAYADPDLYRWLLAQRRASGGGARP